MKKFKNIKNGDSLLFARTNGYSFEYSKSRISYRVLRETFNHIEVRVPVNSIYMDFEFNLPLNESSIEIDGFFITTNFGEMLKFFEKSCKLLSK